MSHRPVHPDGNHYGAQANHQQCLWVHWPVSIHQICNSKCTVDYARFTQAGSPSRVCTSWLCRWLKRKRSQKLQRKCAHCYLKDESEAKQGAERCDNCKLRNWLSNYRLNDVDSFSLFNEFLEMGMFPGQSVTRTKPWCAFTTHIFLFSLLSDSVQLYHHICGSISSCSSARPH